MEDRMRTKMDECINDMKTFNQHNMKAIDEIFGEQIRRELGQDGPATSRSSHSAPSTSRLKRYWRRRNKIWSRNWHMSSKRNSKHVSLSFVTCVMLLVIWFDFVSKCVNKPEHETYKNPLCHRVYMLGSYQWWCWLYMDILGSYQWRCRLYILGSS